MKTMITAALTLISISAFANEVPVTLAKMQKEAIEYAKLSSGGCDFKVIRSPWDTAFRLVESGEVAEISANKKSKITLTSETTEDGSYSHLYKIKGIGSVQFISADDAYDSVTVKTNDTSVTCTNEY